MADSESIIVQLYTIRRDPNLKNALDTIRQKDNSRHFVRSHHGDGLSLKFSDTTKHKGGFMLGSDPETCDIILPDHPSIGAQHCYISFDQDNHLIVRDVSASGTCVAYNNERSLVRRNFTWVIGNHRHLATDDIMIRVDRDLNFRVIVPAIYPAVAGQYANNVKDFLDKPGAYVGPQLMDLGPRGNAAAMIRGNMVDDSQEPIFRGSQQLGRGTFGVVTKVCNVSDGRFYAMKTPVMEHAAEHIPALLYASDLEKYRFIMELCPFGNLYTASRVQPFHQDDAEPILQQALSALAYLHGQTPPIAHRDIKIENILIASCDPLRIKLSDFGSAGQEFAYTADCGTVGYRAPEFFPAATRRYTHSVDVWALGVLGLELSYGTSEVTTPFDEAGWCRQLVSIVNRRKRTKADFLAQRPVLNREAQIAYLKRHELLTVMLDPDPNTRATARQCLDIASKSHALVAMALDRENIDSVSLTTTPSFSPDVVVEPSGGEAYDMDEAHLLDRPLFATPEFLISEHEKSEENFSEDMVP